MAITYKDINYLTQKDTLSGDEKLVVSKNEYITPSQIARLGGVTESHSTLYWNAQVGYIPKEGEIIIYSDRKQIVVDGKTVFIPGIKIGTGNAYVQDLMFIDDSLVKDLADHISDTGIHITAEERIRWNAKLNVDSREVVGEELIINRN